MEQQIAQQQIDHHAVGAHRIVTAGVVGQGPQVARGQTVGQQRRRRGRGGDAGGAAAGGAAASGAVAPTKTTASSATHLSIAATSPVP